jgi:hypothetical protein
MAEENTQAAPSGGGTSEHAAAPDRSQAENPRSRGFSNARDAQQTPPPEKMVRIGESDFAEKQVTDALAFRAEHDVRRQSLPTAPDKYEVKLPADFTGRRQV